MCTCSKTEPLHGAGDTQPASAAVVEAVEQLAAAKGATAAQVALAWLLARGSSIVPIFGTRRTHPRVTAGTRTVESRQVARSQLLSGNSLERCCVHYLPVLDSLQ
jgi:diketogulonate reductase-like aldo/keto reductase